MSSTKLLQSPASSFPFEEVAMLPTQGDNCAVAKRLLPQGYTIAVKGDRIITLKAPCLEGHRFVIKASCIPRGSALLSWGLPFGHAIRTLAAGEVLLNKTAVEALKLRVQSASHSAEELSALQQILKHPPNFEDLDVTPDSPFLLEEHGYTAVGRNAPNIQEEATFMGYRRPHNRGVGTRNHVALIALTASAAPFLMRYKNRWNHLENTDNFDGVRIVAHTEGESEGEQRNEIHILRCLAGFLAHPNLGAAVVVTTGRERHIIQESLLQFVTQSNQPQSVYPQQCFEPPFCQFLQVGEDSILEQAIQKAHAHATIGVQREPCPLSELCIALQCGGSDSFSGLTGNPLAGAMAAQFILNHGSTAILAESPELVGAEPYILERVASEKVARDFVKMTEDYKAYGARHGLSVAGNPSGGNLYRGLYNIVLKSLGAARKKPPNIALDAVLQYGEPMKSHRQQPYYAFMDSPGNDLESIEGQVAGGANLIIFITGNGAMTNFPFVPTLKVVTTSKRYTLLEHEMDINAEPYGNGGQDRVEAIQNGVDLCVRIASGERSKGEAAGHSQVSIWRNWARGDDDDDNKDIPMADRNMETAGTDELQLCTHQEPHTIRPDPPPLPDSLLQKKPIHRVQEGPEGSSSEEERGTTLRPWSLGSSLALIPTSLCSSAVAASFKDHILEEQQKGNSHNNIVCPSHTEGCGAAGDATYERRYQRLMMGHALHPSISRTVFLEHGCEKTHNDYFRHCLHEAGAVPPEEDIDSYFAFWSLQGGGGYEKAQEKVVEYLCGDRHPVICDRGLLGISWCARPISVGLLVDPGVVSDSEESELALALGLIVRFLSQLHVHTVVPANSPLVSSPNSEANRPPTASAAGPIKPPSTTGDMEDFFAPSSPKKTKISPSKTTPSGQRKTFSSQFAAEALVDATVPVPTTLLAGQLINQHIHNTTGGLHVMELPEGASWDETVSCLGPACDAVLLVAGAEEMSLLPSCCLAPTLRLAVPPPSSDMPVWQQWTVDTCNELDRILRSPLVSGSEAMSAEEVVALQKTLFSLTTFVVPRGPTAVSF